MAVQGNACADKKFTCNPCSVFPPPFQPSLGLPRPLLMAAALLCPPSWQVVCVDGSSSFTLHAFPSSALLPPNACNPHLLRLLTHSHAPLAISFRASSPHAAWSWLRAFAGLGCVVRVRRSSAHSAASLLAPSLSSPRRSASDVDAALEPFLPVLPLHPTRLPACPPHPLHGSRSDTRTGREGSSGGSSNASNAWSMGEVRSECIGNAPPNGSGGSSSAGLQGGSGDGGGEGSRGAVLVCRAPCVMAVVINPKSGRGRARSTYHKSVRPILEVGPPSSDCRAPLRRTACAGRRPAELAFRRLRGCLFALSRFQNPCTAH